MTPTCSGNAFGPPPLFNGTYSETITWTIGPHTNPAVGASFLFFGGPPAESVGLPTGEVTSLTSTFTITDGGGTTVTGTKSLVANPGNWGVCLQPTDDAIGGNFGGAPLTGEIYILGAGVLSYQSTVDDGVTQTPKPASRRATS